MSLHWNDLSNLRQLGWVCGYCGKLVGGNLGYTRSHGYEDGRDVYICPHCENPTAFIHGQQFPGAVAGNEVEHLPESVESLYSEVRRCIQYNAPTSAVLAMRKLLMHFAVEKGAEENQSFLSYVDYLSENGYVPPDGKEWVDQIRKRGNEANHEISIMSSDDALELLDFCEMLLKFSYEFPSRIRKM